MSEAKVGDYVQVHYTGKLASGDVFDSSEGHDPLGFTVGGGEMIAGFDAAVQGMAVGQSKDVVIEAANAYGDRREDLVHKLPKEMVQLGVDPEIGMQLQMQGNDGSLVPLVIADVDDTSITVDANHPLAGEDLHFNIRLVQIGK